MMSKKIIQEITRVNTYEYKWKIKTNQNKFQILTISKTKPAEIIINNNKLTYNDKIKTLRLTIGRCGIRYHIKERAEKRGAALMQLRHFKNLNEKTLVHLYKTLIKPILEYLIIPICISSSTNKQKLQSVQNRALYMASKLVPPCNITSEQLHIKYSMEPINTILYYRTQKVWGKLTNIKPELTTESINLNNGDRPDHTWWRRVAPYVSSNPPIPPFVRQTVTVYD